MDFDYMQKLRWWLGWVDAWPSKVLGERVQKRYLCHHKTLLSLWTCSLILQVEYIRRNQNQITFFELGRCYITALSTFVVSHRVTLVMMKSYQIVAKEFVEEMHLFHHRNSSDFAFKTYKEVEKYCKIATIILQLQTVVAPLMFNLIPVITNISSGMFSISSERPVNGTFKQSCYFALPFDYTTNLPNYIIIAIVNIMLCFWVGISICMFDLYLSILVAHIWGHIKILDHELRHFMRPSEHFAWFTPQESEEVAQKLRMLIDHHRQIMRFVYKCSTAFGPMLAIYFTYHQICCCILLLECSKMDTESLLEFGPMTLVIFQQLIQISTIFEFLGSKSEGLADSLYSIPWECMAVRERRVALFFFHNAQEPIHIKALGLVPIGVRTMAAILKTSLSYFIMLQTLAIGE